MILKAYSIFDNKALQYHPPFFASTHGAATRMLADLVIDKNSNIGRHPGDYVLYCIGSYDDHNGQFASYSPLEHVIDAVALLQVQHELAFTQPNGEIRRDGTV